MRKTPVQLALMLPLAIALAACHREPSGPRTAFDGQAALALVKTQLDFGPRVPGTPAHHEEGDWIVARMKPLADTVIEQRWVHVTAKGDSLPMRNVLARFRPQDPNRVLYLTHWDTRPLSDGSADTAQWKLPIPGANDGASGVAMFIALGEALKKTPPTVGVDLLFVDGEDYGDFNTNTDVLIGSTYFASHLPTPGYQPLYGVLWDMIGDRDLDIYEEGNSLRDAPEVVSLVWRTAADLGYSRYFIPAPGDYIVDDHVPLLKAGLHVIDVIDFSYPWHHTQQDTFDKVSAHSLQVVGDVAMKLVTGK